MQNLMHLDRVNMEDWQASSNFSTTSKIQSFCISLAWNAGSLMLPSHYLYTLAPFLQTNLAKSDLYFSQGLLFYAKNCHFSVKGDFPYIFTMPSRVCLSNKK